MEAEENVGARHLTDDELRTIDAVKIVCVVLIPCVVFSGVRGYRLMWGNIVYVAAPLPFVVAVFVQRARANGLKGACGALCEAMTGFVVFWLFLLAVTTLMIYQTQGEEGFDEK